MNRAFSENLIFGSKGERLVHEMFQTYFPGSAIKHANEEPVWEIMGGPRLPTKTGEWVRAPDFEINGKHRFELKTKTIWSPHRNTNTLVTGFGQHCFRDYLAADEDKPCYIAFLQMEEPSGLYGNWIRFLAGSIHHDHPQTCVQEAMFYWSINSFVKIAELRQSKLIPVAPIGAGVRVESRSFFV